MRTKREEGDLIVFGNLVQPSGIVGRDGNERVMADSSAMSGTEPFPTTNAPGTLRQVESMEEVADIAYESGLRLRTLLAPE